MVLFLEPPSTPQVSMLPRALAGRAYRKCRLFCKRSRSPPAHSNIDAGGRRGEPQSDCVGRVPFISQTPEPGLIAIPTVLDAAMLYSVNPTPRDMAIATTAATTPNGNYISLLEPCGRVRAACGAGTDEDSAEQPPETEVSFRTGMKGRLNFKNASPTRAAAARAAPAEPRARRAAAPRPPADRPTEFEGCGAEADQRDRVRNL